MVWGKFSVTLTTVLFHCLFVCLFVSITVDSSLFVKGLKGKVSRRF